MKNYMKPYDEGWEPPTPETIKSIIGGYGITRREFANIIGVNLKRAGKILSMGKDHVDIRYAETRELLTYLGIAEPFRINRNQVLFHQVKSYLKGKGILLKDLYEDLGIRDSYIGQIKKDHPDKLENLFRKSNLLDDFFIERDKERK